MTNLILLYFCCFLAYSKKSKKKKAQFCINMMTLKKKRGK